MNARAKPPADLPPGERAMVGRARHAFTRLLGLEAGDRLTDELLDARIARHRDGAKETPAMTDWQLMEDADYPVNKDIRVRYADGRESSGYVLFTDLGAEWVDTVTHADEPWPTHWMPLPEPPLVGNLVGKSADDR